MAYTLAIVGLGYVGVPLAVEFAKYYDVIGFDIDERKVSEIVAGRDPTQEVGDAAIKASTRLTCTTDATMLKEADVIIVAVPTPVDELNTPDDSALRAASKTVGSNMKKGSIVVYESTVYPGLTRRICVPLLEKHSGMTCDEDFSVGYSPERVNPGDKVHTIDKVIKIVSASNPKALDTIEEVYGKVVTAGLHRAPSIEVAEAAKVVENVQRDMNIAIVNELHRIFETLGIDTHAVLEAAGTKWNFHHYTPGLVGGHCIGVDPYYLIYEARRHGVEPALLELGRKTNDEAHIVYADKFERLLSEKDITLSGSNIAVLGVTFKENCSDTRNSRTKALIAELTARGANVVAIDPRVSPAEVEEFAPAVALADFSAEDYDGVIIAAPHTEFSTLDFFGTILMHVKNPKSRQNVS